MNRLLREQLLKARAQFEAQLDTLRIPSIMGPWGGGDKGGIIQMLEAKLSEINQALADLESDRPEKKPKA